jgi:hypothetical protein
MHKLKGAKMANPIYPVPVPKGSWIKVATAVTTGTLHRKDNTPTYKQTYRLTGEAAPTLEAEGVLMFVDDPEKEIISHNAPIDVYVWCVNADGKLRVDV